MENDHNPASREIGIIVDIERRVDALIGQLQVAGPGAYVAKTELDGSLVEQVSAPNDTMKIARWKTPDGEPAKYAIVEQAPNGSFIWAEWHTGNREGLTAVQWSYADGRESRDVTAEQLDMIVPRVDYRFGGSDRAYEVPSQPFAKELTADEILDPEAARQRARDRRDTLNAALTLVIEAMVKAVPKGSLLRGAETAGELAVAEHFIGEATDAEGERRLLVYSLMSALSRYTASIVPKSTVTATAFKVQRRSIEWRRRFGELRLGTRHIHIIQPKDEKPTQSPNAPDATPEAGVEQ